MDSGLWALTAELGDGRIDRMGEEEGEGGQEAEGGKSFRRHSAQSHCAVTATWIWQDSGLSLSLSKQDVGPGSLQCEVA